MLFFVLNKRSNITKPPPNCIYLLEENWDDNFKFKTMYHLTYLNKLGTELFLGTVKIGRRGQTDERGNLPDSFHVLPEEYFSLGVNDGYYETLNTLSSQLRHEIFIALHDLAFDLPKFDSVLHEPVVQDSLLRTVTPQMVRGQFHRIAMGGARLCRYDFFYTPPPEYLGYERFDIHFQVDPVSSPPTNVHVLIGRNAAGKTRLLNLMTSALLNPDDPLSESGVFRFDQTQQEGSFANLVSVSFSAFDSFPPFDSKELDSNIKYSYIGLKTTGLTRDGDLLPPKSPGDLAEDFSESLNLLCSQGSKVDLWKKVLWMLESDPAFQEAGITRLATIFKPSELQAKALELFYSLSSGHKIILLTLTRLVETVAERTLILLDEPESHLHPPLLSAFVRALSTLLIDRNGVAIIATHSPVILQEVPKRCVWKLRRVASQVYIERPEFETFGENVGILTREVFGLEVIQAGFHKLLRDQVEEGKSYQSILDSFDGELGGEARAILRSLIAVRTSELS